MDIEKLVSIIGDFVDVDDVEIDENTRIRTDLGLNSFDIVNIIVELEREYNVSIADDKLNSIRTVGEIAALIEEKTKG